MSPVRFRFGLQPVFAACGPILAIAISVLAGAATASFAQDEILLEAELFGSSYDVGEGGSPIVTVSCSGASGGEAVDGIDRVGDWIELGFIVTEPFSFVTGVHSAGNADHVRIWTLTVNNSYGAEVFTENLTTPPGSGVD